MCQLQPSRQISKGYIIFSPYPTSVRNGYGHSSPHGFRADGERWPTVLHYLLAQRYAGTPLAIAIRQAKTAREAQALAAASGQAVREDWPDIEAAVTQKALLAKFKAHSKLREGLLATGNRLLLEHCQVPRGMNSVPSKNRLGYALMQTRSTLRRSAAQKRRRSS